MNSRLNFFILLLLWVLLGCSTKPVDELTNEELDDELANSVTLIDKLITDLSCDETSQCRSIPYGHKACGGALEYKVYSTKNTDPEVLIPLAEQYYELTREFNSRNGIISDCAVVEPPELICNEVCEIVEPVSFNNKKDLLFDV